MSATPGMQRVSRLVRSRFTDIESMGVYNPRHIGSNPFRPWSQHAGADPARQHYGNAEDLTSPGVLGPRLPTNPAHMAYLDQVHAFLRHHRLELGIYELLWRTTNHFDHIHVSTYPRMANEWWRRHPMQGGKVVTVQADEKTRSASYLLEVTDVLKQGSEGLQVMILQRMLNKRQKPDPPLVEDGLFGPLTASVVQAYQIRRELPNTSGDYDAFTRADLERLR